MKNSRLHKGKSIIDFPLSFTVIDIETTGLSPEYDEIIELSAVRIENGQTTCSFSSLVKPHPLPDGTYVDSYISDLTGITNDMLSTAPDIDSILGDYIDFLGDTVLVGHNVNFDINFLYDFSELILSTPLSNNFVDTMRISRRLHPEFQHHRLSDLCKRYSIEHSNAHRSLSDCEATVKCFFSLQEDMLNNYGSLESFVKNRCTSKKRSLRAADITAQTEDINPFNPLYNNVFVFTGVLEKMTRKEAMQIVVNHGGIIGDSVTKKTNYLVLGNNDYCSTIKDGKSRKHKKAEELKLLGQNIEIISENVFYDMLIDEY